MIFVYLFTFLRTWVSILDSPLLSFITINDKLVAALQHQDLRHSDDENINDSDIEDKGNQCNQPSKEQWTDRNSRRKRKMCI